jgi:hypothetical protein
MEIHLRLPHLELTVRADNVKELLRRAAELWECLRYEACGRCGSEKIRLGYRKVEGDFEYFGWVCDNCFARLDFGEQKQTHVLYPRRKPNPDRPDDRERFGGWYAYGKGSRAAGPPEPEEVPFPEAPPWEE